MNRIIPSPCFLTIAIIVTSILVDGVSAQGSELVVRNLNLDLELLPTDFSYTIHDANGDRSGNDAFSTAYGFAIGTCYSFAGPGDARGWLLGGNVVAAQSSYGSIGHLTSFGLRVDAGYGFALNDRWALSLFARGGYHLATFDLTGNGVLPALSASGGGLFYGAALRADLTLSERWLIFLDVGWMKDAYSLSGSGIDASIDSAGMVSALGVSYRFSARPRPLE